MAGERRSGERFPILGGLRGEIMVYQPMQIKEIAVGGLTVETEVPLPLNSLHDLRFSLGDKSVVVKGRVARTGGGDASGDTPSYRSGLEFIDVPERVAAVIGEFIAALRANQSDG